MNSTQNTPIWGQNHSLHRFSFSRQALKTKTQWKQSHRNTWHVLNIDAKQATTNIPECMTVHELQQATPQDEHLQHPKDHIIKGWPESRDQIPQDMRTYQMFWDDMAVFGWIILKERHIVIPEALHRLTLQQLHVNHMGIEETKLYVHESIYWIGMNLDTENHIKIDVHVLIFSNHSQMKK